MPEQVACNLCGRSNPRRLFRLRDYRLQVDDLEWNVVNCRHCGLGYLIPRPAREEMRDVAGIDPLGQFEKSSVVPVRQREGRQAA